MVIDKHYTELLNDVKEQIFQSTIKAVKAVNNELIFKHWRIGNIILTKQVEYGWGNSIVEQLSADLRKEYPASTGYSANNLWLMRQLYNEYTNNEFLEQLVQDLKSRELSSLFEDYEIEELENSKTRLDFVLRLLSNVPWGHHVEIMKKVKDYKARLFYLKLTTDFAWSRNVLLNQIKASVYERTSLEEKQHNFHKALPKHLAEQADETIKSSYNLELLGLKKPVMERELENKMVEHIRDVLIELGYGFAYLGNQYKIKAGTKEYFIDLLFYHRQLQCLVAIELKAGKFEIEYAAKLNLYLEILDDTVKMKHENPSIGILLCAEKDFVDVEYALRIINKPIGVAEYQLTKKLPSEYVGILPEINEIKTKIRT
jgi:predicted nuclease of restriction endonuclease-like (RecB) superfamily